MTDRHDLTNYCEKHDFRYMRFLTCCPICRGETMNPAATAILATPDGMLSGVKTPLGPNDHFPVEMIPNKVGTWFLDEPQSADIEQSEPEIHRLPQQLSLF